MAIVSTSESDDWSSCLSDVSTVQAGNQPPHRMTLSPDTKMSSRTMDDVKDLVNRLLEHISRDPDDLSFISGKIASFWNGDELRAKFILHYKGLADDMTADQIDALMDELGRFPIDRRQEVIDEFRVEADTLPLEDALANAQIIDKEGSISTMSGSQEPATLAEDSADTNNAARFTRNANDSRLRRPDLPQAMLDGNAQDGNGPRLRRVQGAQANGLYDLEGVPEPNIGTNNDLQAGGNNAPAGVAVGLENLAIADSSDNNNPQGD